jgi:serine protease Do
MRRSAVVLAAVAAAGAFVLAQHLGLRVEIETPQASAEDRPVARFWSEEQSPVAPAGPSTFADLAERLSPAVVNIRVERVEQVPERLERFEEFFGPRRKGEATGSGFVVSEDGYVVTNNHVVEDADRIVVSMKSGNEHGARVIGRDAKTDLALIKIDPSEGETLPAAPLGDSDKVRVGEWVMAIGNPFGLEHSVTVGILSARGRRHVTGGSYDDFLQTDASINPGNSGGPLIDMSGRVVGINTAINAAGQGIGFAIPINMAKELLPQLQTKGSVTRGWLGVSIQEVKPNLAEAIGLAKPEGALVSQVFKDSPAEKAGVERRDVIVEFAGAAIKDYNDLPRRVAVTAPGSEVDIVVMREGKKKTLQAVLEEMQQQEATAEEPAEEVSDWGFRAAELDAEARERLSLPEGAKGVVVVEIDPESAAADQLQRFDVILEVNKVEIGSVDDMDAALAKDEKRALLLVRRGDGEVYTAIERE